MFAEFLQGFWLSHGDCERPTAEEYFKKQGVNIVGLGVPAKFIQPVKTQKTTS
ncbi:hypothetical protein ACFLXN_01685 [Chloroflexota bacterium]